MAEDRESVSIGAGDAGNVEDVIAAIPKPAYPPGLRLAPTLAHLKHQHGREELEAAIALWMDPEKLMEVTKAYNAELERYKAAVAAARRS